MPKSHWSFLARGEWMGGNKIVNSTLLPFQLSLLFKKCIVSIDEFTCGHIPYRFKHV
jgi:hypothetical protein